MTTYIFHNDPAHGWLQVSRAELKRLGIIDQISPFSYHRGEVCYLEEDCDAPKFLAAKKIAGEEVGIAEKYVNQDHPIRSYRPFVP